jgi:hypothetical protein
LPQIKAATGHKSDAVVQGYIDRSKHQQTLVAEAVSLEGNNNIKKHPATSSSESSDLQSNKRNNNGNNMTININMGSSVINSPMAILSNERMLSLLTGTNDSKFSEE